MGDFDRLVEQLLIPFLFLIGNGDVIAQGSIEEFGVLQHYGQMVEIVFLADSLERRMVKADLALVAFMLLEQ